MGDYQLRSDNKDLLKRLRRAQEEIKANIVQNKHGDQVRLSQPMSSTLAHPNSLQVSLRKSQNFLKQAKINLSSKTAYKPTPRSNLKRRHLESIKMNESYEKKDSSNKESDNSTFYEALQDIGNKRPTRFKSNIPSPKKSSLVQSTNRVKFDLDQSVRDEDHSKTTKSPLAIDRPLLGYDWIAGMMDVQTNYADGVQSARDTLQGMSDNYLEQISHFRSMNRQDCSGNIAPWKEPLFTPITTTKRATTPDPSDTHDARIIDFTVNSRLFPVPVDGSEIEQSNPASPRYIRISVPKAVLATPHKYKPKGDCSFDSLALPNHCLPGHKYTAEHGKALLPPQDSPYLDLRTSLQKDAERLQSGKSNRTLSLSASIYNKSSTQDILNDSYALQFKLLQLKN